MDPRHLNRKDPALMTFVKLVRAAESVGTCSTRHLANHRLSVSQFGLLETLYHLGPMCQKDIGKKLLKSGGNITTVIDNLEKRGLVERCRSREDRRYIQVHLTEEGETLIASIFPHHASGVQKIMSALSPEEQQQLASLCRKLGKSTECA